MISEGPVPRAHKASAGTYPVAHKSEQIHRRCYSILEKFYPEDYQMEDDIAHIAIKEDEAKGDSMGGKKNLGKKGHKETTSSAGRGQNTRKKR